MNVELRNLCPQSVITLLGEQLQKIVHDLQDSRFPPTLSEDVRWDRTMRVTGVEEACG
jgi:hypothetical protein